MVVGRAGGRATGRACFFFFPFAFGFVRCYSRIPTGPSIHLIIPSQIRVQCRAGFLILINNCSIAAAVVVGSNCRTHGKGSRVSRGLDHSPAPITGDFRIL